MIRPHTAVPPAFIQAYYWSTALFFIADAGFGANVRAAGVPDAGWRYGYYALCIGCALACRQWPQRAPLVGMAESAVNLFLLILGIMLPIFQLTETALTADSGAVAMSAGKLVNFLVTGTVLWISFQRNQAALAGASHWTRRISRG